MFFLVLSLILFVASSLLSFVSSGEVWRKVTAIGGTLVGCVLGLIPAVWVLKNGLPLEASLVGPLPALTLAVGIDPLTAFFLIAILGFSIPTALYAWGYLAGHQRLVSTLPFFPLLVGSMAAVVCARDGFLFLICWEVMSLASFFLVTTEHENREARHAGWIYLIATHLATACLIAFFVLLSKNGGSFLFADYSVSLSTPVSLLFLLALVGFGTKAGIFPLHVWLPHAHPAAPSYISALMSGVMIKTGIYGILRALTFLGAPPLWWGEVLVVAGIVSTLLGVLYALMQHDLKRLLAYHSVENIGIIVTGIGLGTIGLSLRQPVVEILGFGGALFHVWNHALFKGLLFLGAGSIVRSGGTRMIDRLGGLLKKMPWTGATFLIGAAAICGLPPLNGFASEWLIYTGLFHGTFSLSGLPFLLSVSGIVGIAFAGGLAIACFTKLFGVVFLGEPRTEPASVAHESPSALIVPMVFLAVLCAILGIFPQAIWPALFPVLSQFDPTLQPATGTEMVLMGRTISVAFLSFIGFFLVLLLIYRLVVRGKRLRRSVTWDCGFARPTPRMQYSSSSFAEPLGTFFKFLLKPREHFEKPGAFFPMGGKFEEHTDDLSERRIFASLFEGATRLFGILRNLQGAKIQGYLSLIFLTLMALLLWEIFYGI